MTHLHASRRHPRRRMRACLAAFALTGLAVAPHALAGPISTIDNPNPGGAWDTGQNGQYTNIIPNVGFSSGAGYANVYDRAELSFCGSSHWRNVRVRNAEVSLSRWTGVQSFESQVVSWDQGAVAFAYYDHQITQVDGAGTPISNPANSHVPRWMTTFWAGGYDVNSDCVGVFYYTNATGNYMPFGVNAGLSRLSIEDLEGPSFSAVDVPAGWQTGTTIPASWTSTDNGIGDGTVQVGSPTLGLTDHGAGKGAGSAQISIAGLPDGTHTFRFARTGTGWPTAIHDRTIRLDRTAPSAPDLTGATGPSWSTDTTREVSATAQDATSGIDHLEYQESSDGGATWSAPETGASIEVTKGGSTHVRFRALDKAGNTGEWQAGVVRLDRTAPSAPTLSTTPAWSRTPVTLTATAQDATSGIGHLEYQESSDGGATWSAPETGASIEVTKEGSTHVRFRALDKAGNTGEWSPARQVRIDTTTPTVTVTGASEQAWQSTDSVTFAANATDTMSGVARIETETRTGGGAWAPGTLGQQDVHITAEGVTDTRFRAVDTAGNASEWVQRTARLDRTPPEVSLTGGNAAWVTTAPVTLTLTPTDQHSGIATTQVQARAPEGTWKDTTLPEDGQITTDQDREYRVRVTDKAGNESRWSTTQTVRLDTTPPALTLTAHQSQRDAITVSITQADETSGLKGPSIIAYEDSQDRRQVATTTTDGDLTITGEGLTEGPLEVHATARDQAGNTRQLSRTITVDRTAPTVSDLTLTLDKAYQARLEGTITDPSGYTGTGNITLQARTSDTWRTLATGTVTKDGAFHLDADLSGLPDGVYPMRITSTDSLGNSATTTVPQTATIAHAPAVAGTPTITWNQQAATITYPLTAGPAALARTILSIETTPGVWLTIRDDKNPEPAGDVTLTTDFSHPDITDGPHRLRLTTITTTGDTATTTTTVRINRTAPTPTITLTTSPTGIITATTEGDHGDVPGDAWHLEACDPTGACHTITTTNTTGALHAQATATTPGDWTFTLTAKDRRGRQITATRTITITSTPTTTPGAPDTTHPSPVAHHAPNPGPAGPGPAGTTPPATRTPAAAPTATGTTSRVTLTATRARSPRPGTILIRGALTGTKPGTHITITNRGRTIGRTRTLLNGRYKVRITRTKGTLTVRAAGKARTLRIR